MVALSILMRLPWAGMAYCFNLSATCDRIDECLELLYCDSVSQFMEKGHAEETGPEKQGHLRGRGLTMITKTLRKDGTLLICFYTEVLPEAESVHLVGSFDDWNVNAHPMRRLKDGRFMARRRLAPNCSHEYRYLVNGESWINDAEAESYAPNPYGSDNCVVTTFMDAPL